MLTLVTLPAIAVSVVSGVGGFLLHGMIYATAYEAAYTKAVSAYEKAYENGAAAYEHAATTSQDAILKASQQVAETVANATQLAAQVQDRASAVQKLSEGTKERVQEIDKLAKDIKDADSIQALADNRQKLAEAISNSPVLQQAVVSLTAKRLDDLQHRVDGIKLTATASDGPIYNCFGEDRATPDSTIVMYGLKEGGGCREDNRNYYKELKIEVPPE